ncbi:response regulator [Methylobacterium goesingense]|uniref:CheY-like chemotaxis protein n=1 Tax=Methylobacterium goesingense TaxID=243690 RepID=A0ABV2LDE1_9HYPH|nr:response regulator [Methylobacterium goesingense]GJD75366.1 Protein-glutamate methylesterase/protein-glutamine glutaminase [Methylobacterium goesingense]
MSDPLRILIVEDEALILMQLEMLFEDAGHEVVGTAVSEEEAVALAIETRPDIAFVDVRLKDGTSGMKAARAMRDIAGLTVVFLTANVRMLPDDLDGAAAVIPKPFSEKVFGAALPFLEECVRRPPPSMDRPPGVRLAPWYLERIGLRAAQAAAELP